MLEELLLDFLETEELWWHLDNIVASFRGYGETEVREALDALVAKGLAVRDNQSPPWYVTYVTYEGVREGV